MPTDDTDGQDDRSGERSTGAVRGLGEVAFRVEDLQAMRRFYEEVLHLSVLAADEDSVFYDLGPGQGGHTEVLVLFDRTGTEGYEGIDPKHTTVDHVALEIDREDFESERRRLEELGQDLDRAVHEWVMWRSLYLTDPEGNRVELVCHDPSIGE